MKNITRRELLKLGALTTGAGVTSSFAPLLLPVSKEEAYAEEGSKWVPTCCNMCGGQTGIVCQVVDGRVVKIEPNNANPNGFSNNAEDFFANIEKEGGAMMCPKGNSGIMTLYDPDRVKKPLVRTNKSKGIGVDPQFKEVSWDEAYGLIADKLKALKDGGEAHKLVWFSEDHSFTNIQGDFCDLYGTPNYSNHSNLCDTARKSSFKVMMGDERPLADFINTKYILLFGWNPLSAIKWAHLPRIITRAIENGAKMVIVDPNFSNTAAKAQQWVPIRPGTDGALALAMGHVIIKNKLHDEAFIKKWTVGFDEYAKYVEDKTPEWAEKITSVPAKTIVQLAKELATTKPAVVDVWSGPGQYSNQFYGGWAIALLSALTGNIEKKGTMVIPVKKGNDHQNVKFDKTKEKRLDGGKDKYPFFHKSGVYTEYINRINDGKGPYMPKAAMIIFQNMMMSVPGTKNVEEALKKLEFVVVVDTHLSETAQMADVVIPGSCYLERYDWNGHWVLWPVLGLRQPVVKPIFGQPTEYEFVTELGRRLGLKDADGHDFFNVGHVSEQPVADKTAWYEEFLSKEIINGAPKMTLEDLKKLPGSTWVSKDGTKYEKYASEIPAEKLKDTITEGDIIYSTKDGKKDKQIGFMKDGKAVRGFFTPSGKIQFYAKSLEGKKDANGDPMKSLPEFTLPDWVPDKDYPLYHINWKEATHTHSRTQNNPYLVGLKGNNPLKINTQTAKKLGIKNGDEVIVESPHGKVKAMANVTEGIHPEVVGLQHGFGHWALGATAKGRGTSDAALRPTKSDPIGGQAMHKQNCVKVYKA